MERTPKTWRDHPPLKEAASMTHVPLELPWPPVGPSLSLMRGGGAGAPVPAHNEALAQQDGVSIRGSHHPHYQNHDRSSSVVTANNTSVFAYPMAGPYPLPYHRVAAGKSKMRFKK